MGKISNKNFKNFYLLIAILFLVASLITGFLLARTKHPEKISRRLSRKASYNHLNTNVNTNIAGQQTNIKNLASPETWINVFVHGIISITPVLNLNTMNHIKTDQLEDTLYYWYVTNIRQNKFFTHHETKQEVGLKPIDPDKIDNSNSCSAIAKVFDMQFDTCKNYYYTYGWSGFMSNKKRYDDAKRFYYQLSEELKKFREKNIFPKIRLIGFSHGGSECLEIADVIKEENLPLTFTIDELILLGTPVIDNTRKLINESVFKKIYNFYSGSDRVQILDFSQPKKHFSRRKFKSFCDFKLQDNLLQIKLEIYRTMKKKNGEFFDPSKWKKSPPRHSSAIRKNSPGHCEWWFLRYTNNFYRDTFVLDPLPVVAFIPTIIKNLNEHEYKVNKTKLFGNQVHVKIRPLEYSMVIEANGHKTKLDFLNKEKFNNFKQLIYGYDFRKTTKEEYNSEVQKELHKAHLKIDELKPDILFNKKQNKNK